MVAKQVKKGSWDGFYEYHFCQRLLSLFARLLRNSTALSHLSVVFVLNVVAVAVWEWAPTDKWSQTHVISVNGYNKPSPVNTLSDFYGLAIFFFLFYVLKP